MVDRRGREANDTSAGYWLCSEELEAGIPRLKEIFRLCLLAVEPVVEGCASMVSNHRYHEKYSMKRTCQVSH